MPNMIIVQDGYIAATATTPHGTDENAGAVEQLLQHQPLASEGYAYRLRADNLEWELWELPPEEEKDAAVEDYEAALAELGVTE